jgi:hypothetical protein
MKRQPDSVEISILALFEREPLIRHGAHRVDDIRKQMPADSVSYDDLTTVLSDMIHAGWLVGRILPGPGGVAADIVDMDITEEGEQVLDRNGAVGRGDQVADSGSSDQTTPSSDSGAPRCFISYSWDSEDHKDWVRKLAEGLARNGVHVLLDQWDNAPGNDLPGFMEQAGETDFVVVVCSPRLVVQASADRSGTRYEKRIISDRLMQQSPGDGRVIPVLRCGGEAAVPTFLRGLVWIDFSVDAAFESKLEELLRRIFSQPVYVRPPLGPRPALPALPSLYDASTHELHGSTQAESDIPHRASPESSFGIARASERGTELARELGRAIGDVPLYSIWACPVGGEGTFPRSQNGAVESLLHTRQAKNGWGDMLYSMTSRATIVQEGVAFSAEAARYVLLDNGFMCYAAALPESQWKGILHAHALDPISLVGNVVSFLRLYVALWQLNDPVEDSRLRRPQFYGTQLCLLNVRGWELRPGTPGTTGYGHLYDIETGEKGLRSAEVLAPSDGPGSFGFLDHPDVSGLTLLQSLYSAFGRHVEDIPFLSPETLTFRF